MTVLTYENINYILSPDNNYYYVGDGTNRNGNGHVNGTSAKGQVVIPYQINGRQVRRINYNDFKVCYQITSFIIHADLEFIGQNAFHYVSNVASIVFLGQIKEIQGYAFSMWQCGGCVRRSDQHTYNIVFKSKFPIEKIGGQVFEYTSNLTIYFHSRKIPQPPQNTFVGSSNIKIYGPAKGLSFGNISVSFSQTCVDKQKTYCSQKIHISYKIICFVALMKK